MGDTIQSETLDALLASAAAYIETDLAAWLVDEKTPAELADGMRYCTAGGKRLRPALAALTAEACGGSVEDDCVRRAAVGVEMIHAYSLVHDDLPAMDDDDLRRGQPTAHVKYGEAMAILIGDALLTRAMEIVADSDPAVAASLVRELARGAGPVGMVAGQVADMDLCKVPDGAEGLRFIHRRKTGALLRAAARMGAIASAARPEDLHAVTQYAEALGLAFQVIDDVLDATGTAEQLGKTPGKDAASGKRTYVTELGLQPAKDLAATLTDRAIGALEPLGPKGRRLERLATLLGGRTH